MVRRPSRLEALSPPIPRLPPGAGNQADKLEGDDLELAEKGYRYRLGQAHGHARAVATDRESGELALPVGLAHLSRDSFQRRCGADCTRLCRHVSTADVRPAPNGAMVRGGEGWSAGVRGASGAPASLAGRTRSLAMRHRLDAACAAALRRRTMLASGSARGRFVGSRDILRPVGANELAVMPQEANVAGP